MAPKQPRVTARSIIEAGLLAGLAPQVIVENVHSQLPDSAADIRHVKYYQSKLKHDQRLTEQLNNDGELVIAPREDVPYMGELDQVEFGGVRFIIFGSMVKTDERVKQEYLSVILKAYRSLVDDGRLTVNTLRARRVVRLAVNKAWYTVQDKPVPEQLQTHLEEAMAKAKAAPAQEQEEVQEEVAEKRVRVTTKGIITQGLLEGKSDEDILAEVKENFPDGKADRSHVGYYRSRLIKEGLLERVEKPAKEEPEEDEAEAEVAAPAKPSRVAKTAKPAPAAKRAPARK